MVKCHTNSQGYVRQKTTTFRTLTSLTGKTDRMWCPDFAQLFEMCTDASECQLGATEGGIKDQTHPKCKMSKEEIHAIVMDIFETIKTERKQRCQQVSDNISEVLHHLDNIALKDSRNDSEDDSC